eukprot:scaffold32562_cov42-Phaeocystis_antarctica.AAC.1
MAAGSKDASGMGNYEQLGTYAVAEEHAAIRADAAAAVAARGAAAVYPRAHDAAARTASDLSGAAGATTQTGAYDWLRLYFDEVVWPEAREVRRRVEARRAAGEVQLHVVDGEHDAAPNPTPTPTPNR